MRRLYKYNFSAASLLPIATPPHQPILPLPLAPPQPPLAALAASLYLFFSSLAASSLGLFTSKLLITLAVDILYRLGLGSHLLAYLLQVLMAPVFEVCALGGTASQ